MHVKTCACVPVRQEIGTCTQADRLVCVWAVLVLVRARARVHEPGLCGSAVLAGRAAGRQKFRAPPDPPAQPTVGIVTSGSVELSWTRPCDNGAQIEKYVLYGRRSRSNRFKRLFTGNALTYHVGGTEGQGQLAPDTVYIFKVKACNISISSMLLL